jgi:hypothetical protein
MIQNQGHPAFQGEAAIWDTPVFMRQLITTQKGDEKVGLG